MTPENFCYWLQGRFELAAGEPLTPEQQKVVQQHLDLVFKKRTPAFGELPRKVAYEEPPQYCSRESLLC